MQSPALLPGDPEQMKAWFQTASWEHKNTLRSRAEFPIFLEKGQKYPSLRKTSIIATIGPKVNKPEMLLELRKAGVNIMRMNFSHGSHEYHASVIANVRKSFELEDGPCVGIALDTKGPEIRTGLMKDDGEVRLIKGSEVILSTDSRYREIGSAQCLFVDYKNLPKVMEVGSTIYIDDGLISLEVCEIASDLVSVKCKVINSGTISSRRGVNLPGTVVDLPALSEKDKADLRFGVEQGIDIVFASFIRKAADVHQIKECLGEKGKNILIISKIESQEGVDNFDEILQVTDGIMVARGDLGIEIPPEKVFVAQKKMIARANLAGKPIICATQMLESMITNPRPTRAEVSDVANAVLDGADCVMLSGETAKGKYPLESVQTMHNVCVEAEVAFHSRSFYRDLCAENAYSDVPETIAASAVAAAGQNQAIAILVLSNSGNTARLVSKYKPRCPIFVVTKNLQTARQCHLLRGVTTFNYASQSNPEHYNKDRENRILHGIDVGRKRGFIPPGSKIVVILGFTEGHGNANTFRIMEVGQ